MRVQVVLACAGCGSVCRMQIVLFSWIPLTPCPSVSTDYEGSSVDGGKKFTKCGTCKYGAECDVDSEDVW